MTGADAAPSCLSPRASSLAHTPCLVPRSPCLVPRSMVFAHRTGAGGRAAEPLGRRARGGDVGGAVGDRALHVRCPEQPLVHVLVTARLPHLVRLPGRAVAEEQP